MSQSVSRVFQACFKSVSRVDRDAYLGIVLDRGDNSYLEVSPKVPGCRRFSIRCKDCLIRSESCWGDFRKCFWDVQKMLKNYFWFVLSF
jgi:hypothetical protein